MIPLDIESL
jgi:ATP-binding cassette subfamily E protein 1